MLQSISYYKAWRAQQWAHALNRGTPEQNYANLPSYCHVLMQANPGTYTFLQTDANNKFKYVFVALGPSIRGYQHMRKVSTYCHLFT